MKFFRELKQGKTDESVRIRAPEEATVDVSIAGQKGPVRALANDDNEFVVKVPGPGRYKVTLSLPFAAQIRSFDPEFAVKLLEQTEARSSFSFEANVEKGLCSWQQIDVERIDLKATGIITGRLLDVERRPVKGMAVYLSKWKIGEKETLDQWSFAFPNDEGRFSFNELREGKYVVLVGRKDFPDKETPYLRNYLPGVHRFSDAFVVELAQGKELELVDFVLPRKLRTRPVNVQIVWPDGKNVTNENASLKDDRPPWISLHMPDGEYLEAPTVNRSSEKGRYTFDLYEGFSYIVGVQVSDGKGDLWNGFVKVTATKETKPIKIVVARKTGEAKEWLRSISEKKGATEY